MKQHTYTAEHLDWLRKHRPEMTAKAAAAEFNKQFSTSITNQAIHATCSRHGIRAKNSSHFKKGGKPWNKGIKGLNFSPATQFKKGCKSYKERPIGTESVQKDGYIWVKIAEPNEWKAKHVLSWESVNGTRPEGGIIIFKDGDNRNFDPENLTCINRGELLRLNRNGYRQTPDELKPAVLGLSKLESALFKAQKDARS